MKKIDFLFLLLFGIAFFSAQERYKTSVYQGNKAFEQGDYDLASSKFLDAVKLNDKDFTAHYNLGNALYKNKKYEDAIAQYQKAEAVAQNTNDQTAAYYNLGNAMMKKGDATSAVEYYKKALKKDPYNENIRKNLQIAKRKSEQNQNKNNEQKDQQQGENNQNKDPKSAPKDQQNIGKNPNGQGQNGQGQGSGDDKKKGENESEKMPEDLQNALLDRIKSREQETARKILNKNTFSVPQSKEKDW